MTPKEYALKRFEIEDPRELALIGWDQWLKCMRDYAREMCVNQRVICAEGAEVRCSSGTVAPKIHRGVGIIEPCESSILNAPLPQEIQFNKISNDTTKD